MEVEINMDIDADAEIDPDLFVKCRLCITKNGVYQIVPTVQDQIKFCFDITVKVFDGLPQVLCKDCKSTLNQYQITKNLFLSNQSLLEQMQKKKVTDDKNTVMTESNIQISKNKTKRRRIRIESDSSDSEIDTKCSNEALDDSSQESSWMALYEKKFVCRFCEAQFKTRRTLKVHCRSHNTLLSTYHKHNFSPCTVRLDKIDLNPNLTGKTSTVVLNSSKIIGEQGNHKYYVLYAPYGLTPQVQTVEQPRQESRCSSRETVVMEDADDGNGFIHIESSNDSVNNENEEPSQIKIDFKESDLRNIQNIISMCQNKYITECKASEQNEVNKSALIKKLMSIGTKIMTGPGCVIASPGLLKYLLHENLNIEWVPIMTDSPNSNYVRVSTEINGEKKSNEGWRVLDTDRNDDVRNKMDKNQLQVESIAKVPPIKKQITNEEPKLKLYPKAEIILQPQSDCDPFTKKLLNANPVTNPKKLPKKTFNVEAKPNIASHQVPQVDKISDSTLILIDSDDDDVTSATMPVITSTASLAACKVAENPNKSNIVEAPLLVKALGEPKTVPRIKCKPVSELMAPKEQCPLVPLHGLTLQPLTLLNMPAVNNSTLNIPAYVAYQCVPDTPCQINNDVQISNTQTTALVNHVVPNNENAKTKDNSPNAVEQPVKYLKSVLEKHELCLVSNTQKYNFKIGYINLIKFKIDVKQQEKTVLVSLSLYAVNNQFYLRLNKPNHEDIDIESLPPLWQKYIICAFNTQVIEKILDSASKNSKEMYEKAKVLEASLKHTIVEMNKSHNGGTL